MAVAFKPHNFVADERELKVLGVDVEKPVVFLIDLTLARASLALKAPEDMVLALGQWKNVLETACRTAYAREQGVQQRGRIRVGAEDFRSALAADELPRTRSDGFGSPPDDSRGLS